MLAKKAGCDMEQGAARANSWGYRRSQFRPHCFMCDGTGLLLVPVYATKTSSSLADSQHLAALNRMKRILAVLLHQPADEVTGSRGLSCKKAEVSVMTKRNNLCITRRSKRLSRAANS